MRSRLCPPRRACATSAFTRKTPLRALRDDAAARRARRSVMRHAPRAALCRHDAARHARYAAFAAAPMFAARCRRAMRMLRACRCARGSVRACRCVQRVVYTRACNVTTQRYAIQHAPARSRQRVARRSRARFCARVRRARRRAACRRASQPLMLRVAALLTAHAALRLSRHTLCAPRYARNGAKRAARSARAHACRVLQPVPSRVDARAARARRDIAMRKRQ